MRSVVNLPLGEQDLDRVLEIARHPLIDIRVAQHPLPIDQVEIREAVDVVGVDGLLAQIETDDVENLVFLDELENWVNSDGVTFQELRGNAR